MCMRDLNGLRVAIDKVDAEIIILLNKRMKLVKEVGFVKAHSNVSALDSKRWAEVIVKRREQARELGINPDLIEAIYNLIHEEALKEEEKITKN